MHKHWILIIAWLLLAWPLAAAAAVPVGKVEVRIKGRIAVDPSGEVMEYRPSVDVPPGVEAMLQSMVRGWGFEPVVVEGRAVTAETGLLLVFDAWDKGGDQLALRLKDVAFGAHEGGRALAPPPYPVEALRSGVNGKVVLLLRVDGEGDVLDVAVEQTSVSDRLPHDRARRYAEAFEKASMGVARRWRFGVRERVDGVPTGGTLRIPVEFFVGQHGSSLAPGPVRQAPWAPDLPTLPAEALAALDSRDVRAVDSALRLIEPVIGATL
ncbi:energy transducer TonB [Luteimonas terricola]|uniref:TonB C-terminal domain-containing protein n=1 Tax=Luteimonas terricola TaxID=645597 RepID=A0ABQ2E679_9GAMM|nr:energy transducer TonB [Luteimonas terricola]GGJ96795.1 hypothetical protein GCM10011394_02090 [Luteimonas terricola]